MGGSIMPQDQSGIDYNQNYNMFADKAKSSGAALGENISKAVGFAMNLSTYLFLIPADKRPHGKDLAAFVENLKDDDPTLAAMRMVDIATNPDYKESPKIGITR